MTQINENERKIIFTPAHLYTEAEGVGSHMEVVSYFNDKKYCVFIMNGKFKGFIYPDKSKIELTQFNIENNITIINIPFKHSALLNLIQYIYNGGFSKFIVYSVMKFIQPLSRIAA